MLSKEQAVNVVKLYAVLLLWGGLFDLFFIYKTHTSSGEYSWAIKLLLSVFLSAAYFLYKRKAKIMPLLISMALVGLCICYRAVVFLLDPSALGGIVLEIFIVVFSLAIAITPIIQAMRAIYVHKIRET